MYNNPNLQFIFSIMFSLYRLRSVHNILCIINMTLIFHYIPIIQYWYIATPLFAGISCLILCDALKHKNNHWTFFV